MKGLELARYCYDHGCRQVLKERFPSLLSRMALAWSERVPSALVLMMNCHGIMTGVPLSAFGWIKQTSASLERKFKRYTTIYIWKFPDTQSGKTGFTAQDGWGAYARKIGMPTIPAVQRGHRPFYNGYMSQSRFWRLQPMVRCSVTLSNIFQLFETGC